MLEKTKKENFLDLIYKHCLGQSQEKNCLNQNFYLNADFFYFYLKQISDELKKSNWNQILINSTTCLLKNELTISNFVIFINENYKYYLDLIKKISLFDFNVKKLKYHTQIYSFIEEIRKILMFLAEKDLLKRVDELQVPIKTILKRKQDIKNKFMSIFILFYLIDSLNEKYEEIKNKYLCQIIYKILKLFLVIFNNYNEFHLDFFSNMMELFFEFSSFSQQKEKKILLLIDKLNINRNDENGEIIFSLKQRIFEKMQKNNEIFGFKLSNSSENALQFKINEIFSLAIHSSSNFM